MACTRFASRRSPVRSRYAPSSLTSQAVLRGRRRARHPADDPSLGRPPIGASVGALARAPCALLRSGCTILATGFALVPRMNLVEVRDVLGCRIVARVRAREGIESLLGSPPTRRSLFHMS